MIPKKYLSTQCIQERGNTFQKRTNLHSIPFLVPLKVSFYSTFAIKDTKQESTHITNGLGKPFKKPLEEWTRAEVQEWVSHSEDFKDFAPQFHLSGKSLADLSEAQFQKELGNIRGSVLYNAVQELKRQGAILLFPRDEGISRSAQVITLRNDSMVDIDKMLEERRICLLRAPPFSGKTSLATFLTAHLHERGANVVHFSALAHKSRIDDCYKNETGKSWEDWFSTKTPITFIIDEAQMWYDAGSEHPFWQFIKRQMQFDKNSYNPNLRILFIAAYGEGPRRSDNSGPSGTPVQFDKRCTRDISFIRFRKEEFEELITNYNKSSTGKLVPISPVIAKAIETSTQGHPGLARKTIDLVGEHFRTHLIENPSDSDIFEYLLSNSYINDISKTRAVPSTSFSDLERDLVLKVVLENKTPFPQGEKEIQAATMLVKSGVLVPIGADLEFAAPIIRTIFIQRLFADRRPVDGPEHMDGFIVDCVHRFQRKTLQHSFGKGKDGKLYERQWQMEFYRAATSVLPSKHVVSVDVGRLWDTDGFLDFYVNGYLQWGIELLREGHKSDEHANRFKEDGKYWSMKDKIKTYALVDCRADVPDVLEDNFYYLVYTKDFETITIYKKGQQAIVISKLVANHSDSKQTSPPVVSSKKPPIKKGD